MHDLEKKLNQGIDGNIHNETKGSLIFLSSVFKFLPLLREEKHFVGKLRLGSLNKLTTNATLTLLTIGSTRTYSPLGGGHMAPQPENPRNMSVGAETW